MKTVDVIVPVYAGYAETVSCLCSLLGAQNVVNNEIVVIYDAGPEPRLLDYLKGLATDGQITLLINPVNTGFVKTVNRGMLLHRDRDVVLLNSDTQVANNWLDRLLACAQADPRIATVTPFSNNAEICSFPSICQSSELPQGWDVATVDRVFALHVTPASVDIPTAVGFCMLIVRKALEEVGYFNEALFGRGYGEENDLCRRLVEGGWRNVLCTNIFVYHCGAVSFGKEKAQLVTSAMKTLDRLYPDYHRLVHEFIEADLPSRYRIQAQLALLDASRPRILCITHNLDGGTTKHVRELSKHVSRQAYFFVARMRSAQILELSARTDWGDINLYFRCPQQTELLERVISWLGISKAHIHHLKDIERFVHNLLKRTNLPYDITLHDYYLINGNPALTNKTGQFCADVNERDRVCGEHSEVPLSFSPEQWRSFSGDLLRRADRIFVPSHYAADLFAQYFPQLSFTVASHPDWEVDAPYPAVRSKPYQSGQRFKVVAIGALGLEKGADILEQVALLAAKLKQPIEFHLLGYAYRELNKAVVVHGAYDDRWLDKKLAALEPHVVWFPCQWPETYSYTLSACLRGGYPVLAPALGAFVERLQGRPLSWLHAFPSTPEQWLTKIIDIKGRCFSDSGEQVFAWKNQPLPSDVKYNYLNNYVEAGRHNIVSGATPDEWLNLLQQVQTRYSDLSVFRRERLLRTLLRLRQMRVIRVFSRLIPFSFQRRIKRSLSSRALHQIARDLLMLLAVNDVVLRSLSVAPDWV